MRRYGLIFIALCLSILWGCSTSSTAAEESSPDVQPDSSASVATSSGSAESSSSVYVYVPGFDPCRFNFGAGWQASHEDSAFYAGLDYISVWLGDNDYFNSFESRMLDVAVQVQATPMIYAYVIAEFGKDHGLEDCDIVGDDGNFVTPNLCTDGANIIRTFFQDSILYRYQQYAKGFREYLESNYPMETGIETIHAIDPDTLKFIWLIEPDFYQYSESGSNQKALYDNTAQNGGGIPDATMAAMFNMIVDTIKAYLPASQIAIDISPWAEDQAGWYANFDLGRVDYASTSGGRTAATLEKIRAGNKVTWAEIATLLGKPILADAGYDAGGAGTGYSAIWGVPENLNARIANGVIGVTQMDADDLYAARVDSIRPYLNPTIWCNN